MYIAAKAHLERVERLNMFIKDQTKGFKIISAFF